MRYIVNICVTYSRGECSYTSFELVDYIKLCGILVKSIGGSNVNDMLSWLGKNVWKHLWESVASAAHYYADNQEWTKQGPHDREIARFFLPAPLRLPGDIIAEDRRIAEECLEHISVAEEASIYISHMFPERLLTALGRFVPSHRRTRFSILQRILQSSQKELAQGLGPKWDDEALFDIGELPYYLVLL